MPSLLLAPVLQNGEPVLSGAAPAQANKIGGDTNGLAFIELGNYNACPFRLRDLDEENEQDEKNEMSYISIPDKPTTLSMPTSTSDAPDQMAVDSSENPLGFNEASGVAPSSSPATGGGSGGQNGGQQNDGSGGQQQHSPNSPSSDYGTSGDAQSKQPAPDSTAIDVELVRSEGANGQPRGGEGEKKEEEPPVPAFKSLIGVLIATVLGGLVILAGSQGSCDAWKEDSGVPAFAICGIFAFVVNWIMFIPAWVLHTEKFYDLVGGITHITVMILGVILSWHTIDYRGIVAAVCVTLWALRLAGFLFLRIAGDGAGDARFDAIKFNFWQFFMTWTLQGLWITINTTAALALVTTKLSPEDGWASVSTSSTSGKNLDVMFLVGITIWLFAWVYESIADEQKRRWRKIASNRGKWIAVGLWHYSRHPNYFGEMTLWLGMALASLPILFDYRWVMLISPIFCCFLITCVSGVPMLTTKAKKKWGHLPEWQEYMASTPALIPGPPACW